MADTKTLDIITRDELRAMLEQGGGPAVSIYHPTSRVAVEIEENSLRLKNLLPRAHEALAERGMRRRDIVELLKPINDFLGDANFWRHQLDGLAIFRTPDFFRYYRLPFAVDETVVVGDRLHTKPLLQALSGDGHFYVLSLSQNSVRFFRATRFGIDEIDLDNLGIPRSLAEALRYDDIEKMDLQRHPRSPGSVGARDIIHGHGPGGEDQKNDILRYFNGVDSGISKLLASERAPLVLAAVDYLQPLYRQASAYRFITEKGVEGNPDQLSPAELHARAWPVVEPHFRADLERTRERYLSVQGTGLASSDLDEVLEAAHTGRVETLLVRRGDELWGRFAVSEGAAIRDEGPALGDVELLDLAARETLMHGGNVYLVEADDMPGDGAVAAIYRY